MREIKFRGKRLDNGELVCGCLTRYSEHMSYITVDLMENETHQVLTATVGQFIGLHDKNGKEIYEGDILGRDGFWSHYVGVKDASFVMIPCEPVQRVNWTWHPVNRYVVEDWEVIGNIHDNPEFDDAT